MAWPPGWLSDVGGPDDGAGSEQWMSPAAGVRLVGHQERLFGRLIRRPRSVRPGRGCSFLVWAHRARAAGQRQRLSRGRARCDDGVGDQHHAMQGLSWRR